MKMVKRIAALILVVILLGLMAWVTMQLAEVFNTNTVTYDGRTYTKSDLEVDADTLELIKTLDDTGVNLHGMEVFDDLDHPYASTIIYLKMQDGTYLMYVLSGGP